MDYEGKTRKFSVEGAPYCKFCHEEARDPGVVDKSTGVRMEVVEQFPGDSVPGIDLVFKNPEYGKMFEQANRPIL